MIYIWNTERWKELHSYPYNSKSWTCIFTTFHKFIKELRLLGNQLANQPKLIRRKTRWLKAEMGCEYFFPLDWCSWTSRMRGIPLKLWMNWLAVVECGLMRQYRILRAIDIMEFRLTLLHWPQRALTEKTGESPGKNPAGTHWREEGQPPRERCAALPRFSPVLLSTE